MRTLQQVMGKINKKWVGFFLLIFVLGFFVYFEVSRFKKEKQKTKKHLKYQIGSYFSPFDIDGFTSGHLPLLSVKLEEETIPLIIDIGFCGGMRLSQERLSQIKDKKELGIGKNYGFRGKGYIERQYEVPLVWIGLHWFSNVPTDEESEEFLRDSVVFGDFDSPHDKTEGSLGWHMFGVTNLLLDMKNKKIVLCDGIETLQKNGYFLDDFAKTELITDHQFLEIIADTSKGPMHCMLDTGTTVSVCNMKGSDETELEKQPLNEREPIVLPSFKISGKEFGAGALFPIILKDPFISDAILGMDFFREHVVFLDFIENCVFIAKAKERSVE